MNDDNVPMRSPTQPDLSEADITDLLHEGLGPGIAVTGAAELTGGGFATVWRASIDDGRQVVVKAGPAPGTPLLGYERGLIAAEAEYFRLVRARVPAVPVPEVLHEGDNWLITTFLPGRPLEEHDDPAVRAELGAAVARVHTVTGTRFGYTGDRPSGADWPAAYAAMTDGLLSDADRWRVPLPAGLNGLAGRHAGTLAVVTRPALVHFDLWDGNVLGAAGRLTGLVDGERYLYGDPLVDLVSPALMRRIEDEPDHPFLLGYGSPVLDRPATTRLSLYRVHLYLLMLAEGPSRGIPVGSERHHRLTALLESELTQLR